MENYKLSFNREIIDTNWRRREKERMRGRRISKSGHKGC